MRVADPAVDRILPALYGRVLDRLPRNELRERFVRGREQLVATGLTVPAAMLGFQIPMDWPRKTVEVFSARLQPRGYSTRIESSLTEDLDATLVENSMDVLEPQAIRAAVQYGCSFVFCAPDATLASGVRISPRSPFQASAIFDRATMRVTAALEVVGLNEVRLHLPYAIRTFVQSGGQWREDRSREQLTGTERVLCAPYVHGMSLERPYGESRVTETVMGASYAATRTLLRQEVAAEFYSSPRSVILGADSSVFDAPSAWSAVTGAVWGLPDVTIDDDQDMPDALRRADLQQIPQMSMQPFSDQYRLLASVVSGASSVPLHYLGVTQDSNPTSAEAIEAVENDLVRAVRGQQPSLGVGRRALALNVLAAQGVDLRVPELRFLKERWEDPRTKSLAVQSQFVETQIRAGNMIPGTEATMRQLPIDPEDAEAFIRDVRRAAGGSTLDRLLARAADGNPG